MYAGILRRSAATLIDVGVVVALVVYILQAPLFPGSPWANTFVAVAVVLLYEPVLSAYLFTVGQALMGTRVRQSDTFLRISLGKAYKRFALKYIASILGAASAPMAQGAARVSVWPRGDHNAIHDLQAGTVVVRANAV